MSPSRDKIAIVTGAARGIGASIAARLAADGHHIAALDLDEEACARTVRAARHSGRRAVAVAADVSDEEAVREAVRRVADELGPPTVLVNNAGILRDHVLSKMSVEDWDLIMSVHLRGAFLMSRETHHYMRETGWGRIVNLSSTAALGLFGQSNYSAAKAGLQGFTRTLALELGRFGVTVNAVAPGFTATAMTHGIAESMGVPFERLVEQMVDEIPVGRAGQPEDIAHAVAFFADERSSFVSGQVLYVAGGWRG